MSARESNREESALEQVAAGCRFEEREGEGEGEGENLCASLCLCACAYALAAAWHERWLFQYRKGSRRIAVAKRPRGKITVHVSEAELVAHKGPGPED